MFCGRYLHAAMELNQLLNEGETETQLQEADNTLFTRGEEQNAEDKK